MFKKCFTHIMVAMATYFFPKIYVKNRNFSNQAHLFIITFKARIKKNIKNVQKNILHILSWLHGNIFPLPQFFVKNKKNSNQTHFKKIKNQNEIISNVKKCFKEHLINFLPRCFVILTR